MSQKYHHGELKNALVEGTMEMAGSGGSTAVTLRAAARRAGVSHAAVYRHFENRLDLLAAAAAEAMNRLARALENAADSVDSDEERVQAIARAYLAWAARDPGAFRLAFCQELWDKTPYPDLRAASDRASRPVLDATSEISATPEAARRTAVSVWAHAHGMTELFLERQLTQGDLRLPEDSITAAADLLAEGVAQLIGPASA